MNSRLNINKSYIRVAGLCALVLGLASPLAAQSPDSIRPHLAKPARYEGTLSPALADPDAVQVCGRLPKNLAPMGRCTIIVADRLEPNSESAEFVIKQVAAQLGADRVSVAAQRDVTKDFRSLKPEPKRGINSLQEFEMAALIAKANLGGGELLLGKLRFYITPSDRFGDSEISGELHLTLSHSDTKEWSVGRVGPRYFVEKRKKNLSQVTGPSGQQYDVRIVGRRAKVYNPGSKVALVRKPKDPDTPTDAEHTPLFYTEFTLLVARQARPHGG